MNDLLLTHLLELQKELDQQGIHPILGGGLSLYLRQTYLPYHSTRYPFEVQTRSTNDIDLFLNAQLIVDKNQIEKLKNVLRSLRYEVVPEAKNFQFSKSVDLFGQKREIKIDLLSAPPPPEDLQKVEIHKPRIKPIGVSDFHAYLTPEADGIEIGAVEMEIQEQKFHIPSAYNYLILKLNAFDDRKERNDKDSDYGRPHAYDIFAMVTQMDEKEWKKAKTHFEVHREQEYLKKTCQIQKECFSKMSDLGLIRLQENSAYKNQKTEFTPYLH